MNKTEKEPKNTKNKTEPEPKPEQKKIEVNLKNFNWEGYIKDMEKCDELNEKTSSEKKPFEYLYESRKIYQKYKQIFSILYGLNNKHEKDDDNEEGEEREKNKKKKKKFRIQLCKILHRLGKNYYVSEEPSEAQGSFESCLKFIIAKKETNEKEKKKKNEKENDVDVDVDVDYPIDESLIVEFIEVHNYLGMIWYSRKQYNKTLSLFKRSEKLYDIHFEKTVLDKVLKDEMEKIYTYICFFLAQTYSRLDKKEMGVIYSLKTLKNQWVKKQSFDIAEWAMNASVLSTFFIKTDRFGMAEQCLNVARYVLPKKNEKYMEVEANVYLLYAQFYKEILVRSKQFLQLYRDEHKDDEEEELKMKPKGKTILGVDVKDNKFETFDKIMDVKEIKNHYLVADYNDAKNLFKLSKKCYEYGKRFYVMDGYVSDHIKIVGNISSLFYLLIYWEENFSRRIAMYKRRLDLLEPITEVLNPNVYSDTMKQITYEITEVYSSMVEEYFERKHIEDVTKPLNEICLKTIESIKQFQALFISKQENKRYVEKGNRQAYIMSIFSLGSCYYKINPISIELKKNFLILAMREYEKIGAFIQNEKFSPKEVDQVKVEVSLAKEMASLIPIRLQKIILEGKDIDDVKWRKSIDYLDEKKE